MTNFNSKNDVRSCVSEWNSRETVWLFDYDLSLYGFDERRVLDSLDKGITQFVCKFLKISKEKADPIRRELWQTYGTTLAGLMAQSDLHPDEYFDFIHHDGTIHKPQLAPQRKVGLSKIIGEKYVFTNARKDWAMSGLESMGILESFERLFDIEYFDWSCKPQQVVYDKLEAELNLKGKNVVFIEDNAANLIPAIEKGWKTVLLSEEPQIGEWDLNLSSIDQIFDVLD
jgi:putative hydrolase of the HAD superfamily